MTFIIALCSGSIIFLILYLLIMSRTTKETNLKKRVQNLNETAVAVAWLNDDKEPFDCPLSERLFAPITGKIVGYITQITPKSLYSLAVEKTTAAGSFYQWSVGSFIVIWLMSAVGTALLVGFIVFSLKSVLFLRGVTIVFLSFVFGALLPLLVLNQLIAKRRAMMLRQLPDVLDLLCVSVQAGLAFDGALDKVTDKMKGPFIEECAKMLQEMRMGITRRKALGNLSDRCKVQEISLFTAAVIQADQLGVGVAKILDIQAENMRERRKQSVKEKALQAPVKMIIPLAVFIFPVLFIVVLVPSILNILKNFGTISP